MRLRNHILDEVARLSSEDGKPPGLNRFTKATGITEYQWQRYWPEWGDVLEEAGFERNTLNAPIPKDDLLRAVAELTRSIEKPPSRRYVVHATLTRDGFPHHSTLMRRFGTQQALLAALLDWVDRNPGYEDVAKIVRPVIKMPATPANNETPQPSTVNSHGLSESYLPPIIACLEPLARGDEEVAALFVSMRRDPNHEFERRVGIAFELLGFEVEQMGQGYGRVADGVANCTSGGWSVIYDAKVRRDRYRLLTEDRKFREYIETHVPAVKSRGNQRCYFAIVSSQFSDLDLERAYELVRLTDVKACVFIEAAVLVALVEERLRNTSSFTMDYLERVLMHTRVLTIEEIRKRR